MKKILITTSSFDLGILEIATLKSQGYEIILNPHGRKLTETEIKSLLTPDVVGLIAGVEPLTADVINNAKGLRVISRCGAGLDSVDVKVAEAKGIEVLSTPDAPTDAVAELTVGLMLDVLRGIAVQDRAIRAGKWTRPMGGLLGARSVGLIGFGRIGRRVAELLSGFNCDILAYDPFQPQAKGVQFMDLDALLAQADIVSLHVPFSAESRDLMNAERIGQMKQGAILINTARGGLVDESALEEALKSGRLAGAGLDVFGEEPYKGSLIKADNIVLTAHTGSYALEARARQEAEAARNLLSALNEAGEQKAHGAKK